MSVGATRLHVRVHGQVQGVGFRRFVERAAQQLTVLGWVRNRGDGTVEVCAVGAPDDIAGFRERLRAGPPYARVDALLPVEASVHRGNDPDRFEILEDVP